MFELDGLNGFLSKFQQPEPPKQTHLHAPFVNEHLAKHVHWIPEMLWPFGLRTRI